MPTLEELLLKRSLPTGENQPLPTTQNGPISGGQKMFEGGVDSLLGLLGVGPDTKANQTGQLLAAGLPLMRVGGKIIKNVGGVWKILDDAEQTTALNKIKPFDSPQSVRSLEDLSTTLPPKISSQPPPPSSQVGAQGNGRLAGLAKSKLNQTMILDIRKRGASGEDFTDLAKEFGVKPYTIYDIVKGNSFGWVK